MRSEISLEEKKMISEALKKITQNFTKGFYQSTFLGWIPNYDNQGRPLNCDPNYKDGTATIEGKTYWFTRHGWKVRVWDRMAMYTDFMSNKNDFIEEIDLTPDYILERLLCKKLFFLFFVM